MQAKINERMVFTLEFEENENSNVYVFIKQPSESLTLSVLPALRKMWMAINEIQDPAIIITDWQQLIEGAISKEVMKNFLTKLFATAKVLTSDLREITYDEYRAEADEQILNMVEGTSVFICASSRYITPARRKSVLQDFQPSPTFEMAIALCKKQLGVLPLSQNTMSAVEKEQGFLTQS